jgi:N,N'-diacetyllegionaminate synthase|tara:strand:+ start:51 stop:1055 length:1005 start_codon:yes stop_codon:yes gene_type:complete
MKESVYIIAEIGNTHEGSLGLAKCFIKAAADCGVDCVKFQTHIFDAESLTSAPNPPYFKDETRKEYFDRTAFTIDEWKELKRYCEDDCGKDFISSPFSLEAVDLLNEVGIKSFKIPSGEVTNLPFLEHVAKTGKQVILSSGMNTWEEMDEAVETLRANGCTDLIMLQCTSEYPCPPEKAGLNIMLEMKEKYNVPVGFSDHTLGSAVPITAVVMGAVLIEKHFTLSQLAYGSDAKNSTEPEDFKRLVSDIRMAELAINSKREKKLDDGLRNMKMIFEKSIVAAKPIQAGEVITREHLAYKKPGDGIPAREFKDFLGKTLKITAQADHKFVPSDFE